MTFELCERGGFDAKAIARRLSLLGLSGAEMHAQGRVLQDLVIRPNVDAIVDSFYDALVGIEVFNDIVSKHSDAARLKETQRHYLLGMGVDFGKPQYFEERLRIGSVHQNIGVPQSLYQCTFRLLQCLLIQYIPRETRSDESSFDEMIQFILKITALDMSLAVECYCASKVFGLEKSLESACGERERFHHLAVTDSLTELHNHSYSRRCLTESLRRARADGSPLCVIMADLDHFKEINDRYGHLVGDQVLRIAAARMTSGARAGDEICRYGGEEFLLILQNTDIREGTDVAERVRTRINSDAMHGKDAEINVSLSLGIAQARESDNVDSLIERADAALYSAKLAGRDCVRREAHE